MALEIANIFYAIGYAEHPSGSTGTFDILVDLGGLTPKAAIFFYMPTSEANLQASTSANYPSLGFTDGTNQVCYVHGAENLSNRSDHKSRGYTAEVAAHFTATGSGGADDVQINFDSWRTTAQTGTSQTGVRLAMGKNNDSVTFVVGALFFAGSDFQAAVGVTALSTQDTFVDETGPGFQPEVVIGITAPNFSDTTTDGFHHSIGIAYHDGATLTSFYDALFAEDNGDPADSNKEADITADHFGMHFTGSYTAQEEVEIGQFDSSGFSLRARGANATDDVGWIAMDFGGVLGIDLRTTPLWVVDQQLEEETGYGFYGGLLFCLSGVGVGTDPAANQDMKHTLCAHVRNRTTGKRETIGTHCGFDAGNTTHRAAGAGNVGEARAQTVNDFSWNYDISVVGFGGSSEWEFPTFHADGYTVFVFGNQSAQVMDHNIILGIQDPLPPLSPELLAAPELFTAPPSFRM